MEEFVQQFIEHLPYVGVVTVLMISGLGVPLPEDIPLLIGGYLCAPPLDGSEPYANIWIMLPVALVAVVGADCLLYGVGRRYGHHVARLPLLRRYLNEAHLTKAEAAFHKHGGKTLFIARFLPGVRAAIFFTAGVFKVPFWKMLAFDGAAALISVPAIVLAAYFFANEIDRVRHLSQNVQLSLLACVVVVVTTVVGGKLWRRRKLASAK